MFRNVHEFKTVYYDLSRAMHFPGRDEILEEAFSRPDSTPLNLIWFLENAPHEDECSVSADEKFVFLHEETALKILERILKLSDSLAMMIKTALHKNVRRIVNINWTDPPNFIEDAIKNSSTGTCLTIVKMILELKLEELNDYATKDILNWAAAHVLLSAEIKGTQASSLRFVILDILKNEEFNKRGSSEDTHRYLDHLKALELLQELAAQGK